MATATGSRALDHVVFVGIMVLMLIATRRILVYHEVTPTKVSVVAIAADGTRSALATPTPLQGVQPDIPSAERRIRSFAETPAARALAPPGGRLEWLLHYSINSDRFDRVLIVSSVVAHED